MKKKLIRNLSILGVSAIVLLNLFVSFSSDTNKGTGINLKLLTALANEYGHAGSGSESGYVSYEMYTFVCSDFVHFAHYCEGSHDPSVSCDASKQFDCAVGHTNYHTSPASVACAKSNGCINSKGEEYHRWTIDYYTDIITCERCGVWFDTADPAAF